MSPGNKLQSPNVPGQMLPGTQIHSLRIESCLILEVTKGLSSPCASCTAAPALLCPKAAGPAPAAPTSAALAEKVAWCVPDKGCEGGTVMGSGGGKVTVCGYECLLLMPLQSPRS